MSTNFIYFSSGNTILHNRTILSVLSLASVYTLKPNEKIIIFTDVPQCYEPFLNGLPIDYQLLTKEHIKEMMGKNDLIHRVKIAIIEKATQLYPEHNILYADSDTFFYENLLETIQKISSETSIMHKFEYEMSFLGTYPSNDYDHFRAVYDVLSEQEFILKEQSINIKPESFASWNAGIIGLHHTNFHWFREVYELTDQLYAPTKNHACEQYAFSYFLQKRSTLISFEQYNRHYWHKIEKKIVDEFLAKKFDKKFLLLSKEEKIIKARQFCMALLKIIPSHAHTHRYNAMIAFQEKKYLKGYKASVLTLLKNPFQDIVFFKDILYYTRKMML
jgi:hypothetical protein